MAKASKQIENQAFADRLQQSLKGIGIRPSPTQLANEFNLRYRGESITITTARNWLLGHSIPTQDKLKVLATWLHVGADELRFGTITPIFKSKDSSANLSALTMQDRDMLTRYLALPLEDRKTASNVVLALSIAASIKVEKPSVEI